MGIGKGKSADIDLEGLMQDIDNEHQAAEQTRDLTEQITALREATTALQAANARTDSMLRNFNQLLEQLHTISISAHLDPEATRTLQETCTNLAVSFDEQLTAHRKKQLAQQQAHEQHLMRQLADRPGIWITDRWIKFLYIFFAIYNVIVFLYVKFGR